MKFISIEKGEQEKERQSEEGDTVQKSLGTRNYQENKKIERNMKDKSTHSDKFIVNNMEGQGQRDDNFFFRSESGENYVEYAKERGNHTTEKLPKKT